MAARAQKTVSVCYGYGRHSTNKQELTREVQEFRTHEYWERNLRPKGVAWGGFLYDAATSAKVPLMERTEGARLSELASRGDHVVVTKMDRAFRSLRDGIVSIDLLSARGVVFHSLDLQVDTSTPLGRFFRSILLAVAELEREFVSERVKETIAIRKREGKPHGKACPVGWKIVGRRPHREYRVDTDERRLIDLMTDHRRAGMSYDAIALWTIRQHDAPAKRAFSHRDLVRWAIMAREAGYPKITNYKEFRRMVRAGEMPGPSP
jgi:DNA invertase Pin-like site-specific DNA recombinase